MTLGVVPVVNENDTVVTEEIRYGDNDRLAARVAQMVGADILVLLSDIDGLYTADPRSNPEARHLARIDQITPEIEAMAGGANAGAGVGTGGMATKLAAARIAQQAGCATVVSQGRLQGLDRRLPGPGRNPGHRRRCGPGPDDRQEPAGRWLAAGGRAVRQGRCGPGL